MILGGLVVLALTAALVAPYFIDWSSYRADFEREAGRILGRDVTVEGDARARLLPFPSVTFSDVTVAGEGDEAPPAMTVDTFSMDAELAPFLRGEVLIFDMRVVRPSVRVEVDADGAVDWAMRPSTRFDPRQVRLEQVAVTDGHVDVHHRASGRTHRFDDIDARLSARSIAGPWRVDGTLSIDGTRTAMSISTGTVDGEGALRLRLRAEPEDYPLALETEGHARVDGGGRAEYAGAFRISDPTGEERDETTARNRVSGQFSLDHELLDIEEFRFETGPLDDPYTADGAAEIALGDDPRFTVTAEGSQVRFDAPEDGDIAGMALESRLAALRTFVKGLPKPAIPGTVEIRLPAVVTGDTTIRDIALSAEPAEAGWSIASLAATLPGRTRLEGDGLLETGDTLAFSGSMLVAVGQPSGFAAWMARDVDEAIRRLPSAGFSADVDLAADRQVFDNLELILGDARFRGRMERHVPPGARPSVAMELDGDRLEVEGMTAFASLFVGEDGVNRFAGHDIDLEVRAGPVSAVGLTADSVDTALRLREEGLEIDRLTIGGLAGATVSATGELRELAGQPRGQVDASIVSVDLAPLVETLAGRFPQTPFVRALQQRAAAYPGLLEDAEIDVVASAVGGEGIGELALSADGTAGGTRFSLSGSSEAEGEAGEDTAFSMSFSGRNDEAAALYALYGLPGLPLGLAGAAQTELSAKGTLGGSAETSLRFSGDGLDAGFDGTVTLDDGLNALSGQAHLASVDAEPWLAAAGVSFPGFGLGLPARLDADVEYSDDLLIISDLEGVVAGGTLAGDLNATMMQGTPHISGAVNTDTLDLGIAVEMVLGDTALSGTGADGAIWPGAPFAQNVRAPFSANVNVAADTLLVDDFATARRARMMLGLDSEGLDISEFSATLHGGRLEGLAELANNDGTGLLSAQLGFDDAAVSGLLAHEGVSGRADLTASLNASGRSVEAMVSSLSGSGSAALRDFSIDGLNPNAFEPILDRADAVGREVDAEDTAAFVPGLVSDGTFDAGEAELAFTVSSGVARAPSLSFETAKAALGVEARADLTDLTTAVEGRIVYDPGLEGAAGAEPAVGISLAGPLQAPRLRFETDELAQFLTQRALEREQARVERMQAVLLEQQRLRREQRYYAALADARKEAEMARRIFEQETERRRRQAEEVERREADENPRDEEGESGTGGDDVERAPLPAPEQTGGREESEDDDVSEFFRPENLTVDGLLDVMREQE